MTFDPLQEQIPAAEPLVTRDALRRPMHDLRISVTDRCNFRCTYCMPDHPAHAEREEVLSFEEIDRLVGAVDRRGYTVIPTAMYWSRGRAKVEIGMARGKRQHDKRKTEKDRDWERQKGRIMKRG